MKIVATSKLDWIGNYGPGWIGFVRHKAFLSDAIAWMTKWWRSAAEPSVSHVFVVTGPNAVTEANSDGVDEDGLDQYVRNPAYTTYFRKPQFWTPGMASKIVCEAWRYKGLKYDFGLIAADAVSYSLLGHLVNGLTGDALNKCVTQFADSPREMICDKLAAVCLQAQPELANLGSLRYPARMNNPQRLFSDEAVFQPEVTMIQGET